MLELANDTCSLSIDLLPEFGWSVQDEPIYGPGSVFQGSVRLTSRKRIKADYIRLQFHAVEAMRSVEITPGVLRAEKPQTLFKVQHVLWKGDYLEPTESSIPFTIQLPFIQYPPSIDHEYYHCTYKLSAFIVRGSSQILKSATKVILYRPFIETCFLKNSIQSPGGQLKLYALDYVPGDTITATISTDSTSAVSERRKRIVTAKLYQTVMLHAIDDTPKLTKEITAQCWHEDATDEQDSLGGDLKLDMLQIPVEVIPSFSYSKLITVSYRLVISVKQKKLGGLWNVKQQEFEFPIKIGTLGNSVRAPSELRFYSTLTPEELHQEIPKFMRVIEYTDSLPPYDSARLPSYDKVSVLD